MGTKTTESKKAKSEKFQYLSEVELAAMTKRQRNRYELSLKHYRDMLADKETTKNRLKAARAQGYAKGLALARAKRLAEKRNFWIAALREFGMTEEEIDEMMKSFDAIYDGSLSDGVEQDSCPAAT